MVNRAPVVIEDIYADPRIPADAYRPTFVKSLAMVPIRTQSPLGAIGNYWASRHLPTEQDVSLLAALADATSLAMENVNVYQQLESRVRERTRQLEDANAELDAFSSAVSHDLRSPLAAIKGFAEILEDQHGHYLGPHSHDMLFRIITETRKMDATITSLLSLSRLDRTPLHRSDINLSCIASEIINRLRAAHPDRSVSVSIEPDLTANADPGLLQIALENLLSNAWKYTAKRPDARISFGKGPQPHSFFISDNGVGIDMAQVHRLFLPFQRLHPASQFPGLGIGLATTRRILARHNGSISASSQPNEGATFTFTLPPDPSATR
jgi:signal transduction histidine kinase